MFKSVSVDRWETRFKRRNAYEAILIEYKQICPHQWVNVWLSIIVDVFTSADAGVSPSVFLMLQMLLREHYDKFPILILKDIKYQELQAMMNYMYRGEVNITQETLGSFLKAAESLQIRGLTDNSNNNCVENNNGIVRDGATHPYHSSNSMSKKLIPDSRKLVVPPHTPPLLSQQPLQSQSSPLQQQPPPPQQRSRSPQAATLLSQQHHKKYLKSPAILENHHNPNATSKSSASSEPSSLDLNCSSSSTKRRKLLPPIKSESLVVTPINPAAVAAAAAAAAAAASTYNNLDVNSSLCNNEVPSQQQQLQPPSSLAPEGKAIMVSSPSGPPKVESPHMDISPVAAPPNKISSATGVCAEPLIKPKPLAELVKVKSEQLDDSFNEDTNDDSQNTEDNCDIDRDDNSQLGGTMPFSNSQSGQSKCKCLFFKRAVYVVSPISSVFSNFIKVVQIAYLKFHFRKIWRIRVICRTHFETEKVTSTMPTLFFKFRCYSAGISADTSFENFEPFIFVIKLFQN